MQVHAVHVYDEANVKSIKDVRDVVASIKDEELGFLNDFDVPYVTLKGPKYPRLKKKSRRLRSDDDSDQDDDDDDEANDDDDDKDDDD